MLGFGGLSLYGSAITSEIGSSERKKSLHFRQNSNLVAHSGGFLRGGTEKAAREGDSVVEKSILERFYRNARTYFGTKCQK